MRLMFVLDSKQRETSMKSGIPYEFTTKLSRIKGFAANLACFEPIREFPTKLDVSSMQLRGQRRVPLLEQGILFVHNSLVIGAAIINLVRAWCLDWLHGMGPCVLKFFVGILTLF